MEKEDAFQAHIPVLLDELTEAIDLYEDKKNVIVDATLWLWWHASHILARLHPWDIFIGFDADERNLKIAKDRLEKIQTQIPSGVSLILVRSNFVNIEQELQKRNIDQITGIYYDLWISSLHVDEAERGFSFRFEGPLDMRFDATQWQTAAEILNYSQEKELYEILKNYGEEPHARKIAAKIIEARKRKKFATTHDLVEFLETEINTHIKTKMRVFQALRIAVNHELENIQKSLQQAGKLLESHGNVFVISFHSLEDRIVKQYIKKETTNCLCDTIVCTCWHTKTLKKMTKKPIIPTMTEQQQNPRSRSAKARHARKL